ncbi:hypothetical protein, partial [Brevibacillus sp. 1238]|uniref:hypothetical protein n=1 Tax=Brevibacillus sp. 1238 TaxID=2940565 RepID=UPI002474A2B7
LSNKVCYWFKAGKSFNDRLINAFAVQFSKSICFAHRPKATSPSYHIAHRDARGFFHHFASLSSDKI